MWLQGDGCDDKSKFGVQKGKVRDHNKSRVIITEGDDDQPSVREHNRLVFRRGRFEMTKGRVGDYKAFFVIIWEGL